MKGDDLRRVADELEALAARVAAVERVAMRDPLTECLNRAGMTDAWMREHSRMCRGLWGMSIAFLDIDHFKQINDTRGHDAGDLILRQFADTIRSNMRPTDALGRWGGEEFIILLPETLTDTADHVVERIRFAARQIPLNFSAGIVAVKNEDTLQVAAARADVALYAAKNGGRDRTVVAP